MKALRQRVSMKLTVHTEKKGIKDGVACETIASGRKKLREMSESDFAKIYKLEGEVMESTNRGMQVLFATRLSDGESVVIKVRDRSVSFGKDSSEREWLSTTQIQLNMPCSDTICKFLDVVATKTNYYVVMERVAGQDLFEQMSRESISHVDTREIIYQILIALKTLHDQGRIHKDLKMENVMVDMQSPKEPCSPGNSAPASASASASRPTRKSWVAEPVSPNSPGVKLIDFDTVEDWEPSSPKSRDVLGTDGYIAPEAYSGQYSPASDIFCVGVIMYKLLTRKFPYPLILFDDKPGENYVGSPAMERIQERLKATRVDFTRAPLNLCPDASDLCSKMLAFGPCARPSAEEALSHKWFTLPADDLKEHKKSASASELSMAAVNAAQPPGVLRPAAAAG